MYSKAVTSSVLLGLAVLSSAAPAPAPDFLAIPSGISDVTIGPSGALTSATAAVEASAPYQSATVSRPKQSPNEIPSFAIPSPTQAGTVSATSGPGVGATAGSAGASAFGAGPSGITAGFSAASAGPAASASADAGPSMPAIAGLGPIVMPSAPMPNTLVTHKATPSSAPEPAPSKKPDGQTPPSPGSSASPPQTPGDPKDGKQGGCGGGSAKAKRAGAVADSGGNEDGCSSENTASGWFGGGGDHCWWIFCW